MNGWRGADRSRVTIALEGGPNQCGPNHGPGKLWVSAPPVLTRAVGAPLRAFVQRVLSVPAVTAVEVDHRRGVAQLSYRPRATGGSSSLLHQLSRALVGEPPPQPAPRYFAFDLAIGPRLPAVTRFERVRFRWQVVHELPGRLRARHPQLCGQRRLGTDIAWALEDEPGVLRADARAATGAVLIRFDPARTDRDTIMRRLETISDVLRQRRHARLRAALRGTGMADGPRRAIFRLLAMLSLGMTVVAFVAPGIPTPPFLILTMYFAIRSWPAMRDRLERSKIFGRMIRDWQRYRSMRTAAKWKSLATTLVLVTLFVWVLDLAGAALASVLAIVTIEAVILLMLPRLATADGVP